MDGLESEAKSRLFSLIRCPVCTEQYVSSLDAKKTGRVPVSSAVCRHTQCYECIKNQHAEKLGKKSTSKRLKNIPCYYCNEKGAFNAENPIINGFACEAVACMEGVAKPKQDQLEEEQLARLESLNQGPTIKDETIEDTAATPQINSEAPSAVEDPRIAIPKVEEIEGIAPATIHRASHEDYEEDSKPPAKLPVAAVTPEKTSRHSNSQTGRVAQVTAKGHAIERAPLDCDDDSSVEVLEVAPPPNENTSIKTDPTDDISNRQQKGKQPKAAARSAVAAEKTGCEKSPSSPAKRSSSTDVSTSKKKRKPTAKGAAAGVVHIGKTMTFPRCARHSGWEGFNVHVSDSNLPEKFSFVMELMDFLFPVAEGQDTFHEALWIKATSNGRVGYRTRVELRNMKNKDERGLLSWHKSGGQYVPPTKQDLKCFIEILKMMKTAPTEGN